MALDTKYRPRTYEEVLGQGSTVAILKSYVSEGRGFHQSYVFCGQHGSGKTTLARIMARALLCHNPKDGEPCDQCESCVSILEGSGNECFEEMDAATKSGKDDLSRIIEDANYSTFSGNRRVYLLDEAHRLSKAALDVLLKPMEDNVPGSDNKRLVILFCTTEPDKMVSTIFSRCAPAFVIRPASYESIADRLAVVCHGEGLRHEMEALLVLAEVSKSHIRDALKALEGVAISNGGKVDLESVNSYFKFDTNAKILELLGLVLDGNGPESFSLAESVCQTLGPKVGYERLSEAAMMVYRHSLGVPIPRTSWNPSRIAEILSSHSGEEALSVARAFSAPPVRVSVSSFLMDCSAFSSAPRVLPQIPVQKAETAKPQEPQSQVKSQTPSEEGAKASTQAHNHKDPNHPPKAPPTVNSGGVYIDPRAVKRPEVDSVGYNVVPSKPNPRGLDREVFRRLVEVHLGGSITECLTRKPSG